MTHTLPPTPPPSLVNASFDSTTLKVAYIIAVKRCDKGLKFRVALEERSESSGVTTLKERDLLVSECLALDGAELALKSFQAELGSLIRKEEYAQSPTRPRKSSDSLSGRVLQSFTGCLPAVSSYLSICYPVPDFRTDQTLPPASLPPVSLPPASLPVSAVPPNTPPLREVVRVNSVRQKDFDILVECILQLPVTPDQTFQYQVNNVRWEKFKDFRKYAEGLEFKQAGLCEKIETRWTDIKRAQKICMQDGTYLDDNDDWRYD